MLDSVSDRLISGLRIFKERFGPPKALVAAGGAYARLYQAQFDAAVAPEPEPAG